MDVSLDAFVAKSNRDLDWIFGSFNDELKMGQSCLRKFEENKFKVFQTGTVLHTY
ncbi:hypothetical protein GMD78_08540 [Ornithinibacillus sp. L9]|uniref:Uncharacterized protein n=1 Tax=Ornithinibacillus caprae TaxID=2678566 RepID=A0A6N8FKB9_9BACI|nr:hypothetical protein [Ornithinibacillus caprae]MUK88437.1 hypothetical protein [Ornithinibacillus caprae]